jgi:hypothetical protein
MGGKLFWLADRQWSRIEGARSGWMIAGWHRARAEKQLPLVRLSASVRTADDDL